MKPQLIQAYNLFNEPILLCKKWLEGFDCKKCKKDYKTCKYRQDE